eukprot:938206_1
MHTVFIMATKKVLGIQDSLSGAQDYNGKKSKTHSKKHKRKRKRKHSSQTIDNSEDEIPSEHEHNDSMTCTETVQAVDLEYPDMEEINILIHHLSKATNELKNPLWKTHDSFKNIDKQIKDKLCESMAVYGEDFEPNPLIKEITGNFADEMSKILSLMRTSTYCRRKIQAMLISSLLEDYEDVEVVCSDVLLENMMQWIEYVVFSPHTIRNDEWNEWLSMVLHHEHNATSNSDMLNLCGEILSDSLEEGKEFVIEELDEVERLINAQIICQSPITIYGYSAIKQINCFHAMVPTSTPHQIQNAIDGHREQMENEQEEVDLPHNILYKLRGYGALLLQGQFYIFETDKMERVILTVNIKGLHHIHVKTDQFDFELHDKEQVVSFGVMYKEHMTTWKAALEHFCEFD